MANLSNSMPVLRFCCSGWPSIAGAAVWQEGVATQKAFCDALPEQSPDYVVIEQGVKLIRVDDVKPGRNSIYVLEEGDIVSQAFINQKVRLVKNKYKKISKRHIWRSFRIDYERV